jgi:GT2 family glycosyltransferase
MLTHIQQRNVVAIIEAGLNVLAAPVDVHALYIPVLVFCQMPRQAKTRRRYLYRVIRVGRAGQPPVSNSHIMDGYPNPGTTATLPGVNSVSIIICTLDRPKMAQRCIDSLAKADLTGVVEIILVDQGPKSNNGPFCKARQSSGLPVVHLLRDRPGVQGARNAAVMQAKGDLLLFTDDDCLVDANWVQAIRRAFSDDAVAGVVGRVLPHGSNAGKFPVGILDRATEVRFRGPHYPFTIGVGNNMAFRRASLRLSGGFDATLGAGSPARACGESEMFYRLLKTAGHIVYTPHGLVFHDAWRTLEQSLGATYGYTYGNGYCLTRAASRGDLRALGYLCGRLGGQIVLAYIHFLIVGDRPKRQRAAQQWLGIWHGFAAGLKAPDPDIPTIP